MEKMKKVLLLVLCAALLVGASVAGTVAYLTDKKEAVNTFTVGKVTIDLNENDYDGDEDFKQNDYEDIIPGGSYEKEPVITVIKDSANCYVRAKVTVTMPQWNNDDEAEGTFEEFVAKFDENYLLSDNITSGGFNTANWDVKEPTVDPTTNTIVYYLYYMDSSTNNIVESSTDDQPLEALFNDVRVPKTLDETTLPYLEGMTIKVEAHAIQAGGFIGDETGDAEQVAWKAFDDQNSETVLPGNNNSEQ